MSPKSTKNFARTFGQDLMRGEGKVRPGRKANAVPGGGAWPSNKIGADGSFGRADLRMGKSGGKAVNTKAIGTTEWVNQKRAEGELTAGLASEQSGTSIFDPVLCELAYRWFCPRGGRILDPFAGGSVRGIVAGKLGRQYVGVDLRGEQLEANRVQAAEILTPDEQALVEWRLGDSQDVVPTLAGGFDLIFACPPYGDLEVYSDDPQDLSTMTFEDFAAAYRRIVAASAALLTPDRFACFVVGDYRDPKGFYRDFPGLTIDAFRQAGMGLYNEAILITAAGSLPIRARKMFESGRKLGKTHQNVLVFCKGDWKKAVEAIGEVEFGDMDVMTPAEGGAETGDAGLPGVEAL